MKKNLSILIKIVISALFIVSAVAKMYPSPYFAISTFEVKQLYPLGFSEAIAPWFSRILIGIELALGFLILQNNYLKKIVIPATIALLAVFVAHLSYETFLNGGNSGNCGCFGELIPMTPIEAIIKNIIAIGLLIWLYLLVSKKTASKFWPLATVTLATIVGIFLIAPIKSNTELAMPIETIPTDSLTTEVIDSVAVKMDIVEKPIKDSTTKETPKKVEEVVLNEPAKKKSGYAQFFSKIDTGRKTLCFFVPGCDHCRLAAKELTEMKKTNKNFPEVVILFMNEEADLIPAFFKEAGAEYPYKIIEIIPFWKLLGTGKDTPGVKYLWNGNEYKYYYGITENQFNPKDYQELINKSYNELKK
jgi:hypothetical protein